MNQIDYPSAVKSNCRELIAGLLTPEIDARFGWNQVRSSPWLADINWEAAAAKRVTKVLRLYLYCGHVFVL